MPAAPRETAKRIPPPDGVRFPLYCPRHPHVPLYRGVCPVCKTEHENRKLLVQRTLARAEAAMAARTRCRP